MIYVVIALFVFVVEMICWGLQEGYRGHWIIDHTTQDPIHMLLRHLERSLNRSNTGRFTTAGRTQVKRMLEWWEHSRWTDHVDVLLRAIELGNSVW